MDEIIFNFPENLQITNNDLLPQRLVEQIRTLISDGTLKPGARLPNEPDLAARFSVSRSTLRVALHLLERGGFIIRQRGIGTFISDEPITVNNLSLNSSITQVIRSIGAIPGCIEILIAVRPALPHVAKRLDLDSGTPLVAIERVRTADDRRVVFTIDYIPQAALITPSGEISLDDLRDFLCTYQSMITFLHERLYLQIHHAIAHLRPMTADSLLADKLQVPLGSGILLVEQVDYGKDGKPIICADEYHVADAFTFSVYRTS